MPSKLYSRGLDTPPVYRRSASVAAQRLEQRGPQHPRRIAQLVAHDGGQKLIVENVLSHARSAFGVEHLEMRDPSSEHDDVGVQDIDDVGEAAAERFQHFI